MIESLRLSDILDKSMYRKNFSSLQADTTSIPADVISAAFKFKRKGRGEYIIPNSQPLDFSNYSSEHLEELWSRFSSSKFNEESLKYTDHNLKYEIMKCYNALDFWWKTPGPKRYSREEIMRSTLLVGPSYAEKLSDEWDYGIRRSHRIKGMFRDYEDWAPIKHYNELPPIGYLIRWKETSSDIEYMKIPLKAFDKDLMDELKYEILECLPDSLELPKDIEILAEVKTSTTLDLDRMKSIPFYMGRLSPEGSQFSRIFKAKRSVIPVGPANTRDAVITTIDTYNSVKKCDLIVGRILDELDSSLVNSSSQVFLKRLKEASRTPPRFGEKLFWLRDIKKCGLTFPRQLIHLIQECLTETYPDKDFSSFDIYRNYSIFDESGKPIKTNRGYCLGMANNCVTFIQCMIYTMLEKRIPRSISLKGFFGNDDSILEVSSGTESKIVDEVDAMMIQIIDFELLDGLNIITNDKKSFWSWYPIIFEEYGKPEFKEKDSRLACALSSAMLAPDIKYAKLLTSSLSIAFWCDGSWIAKCLEAITDFWGFEYYPEEVKYDYSLGGWISLRSRGCSLALRDVERAPDFLLQDMWGAYKDYRAFKKNVLRPVLKGTVTKNYSVTGSILNITYVDDDLYDIPELPVEMIYLDRKGYIDFYESIYRFNRSPYKVMASRIRNSITKKTKEDIEKRSFMEYMLGDTNVTFAIPETLVKRSTSIFETFSNGRTDCNSLRRNCLARFMEQLRIDKVITCSELNIEPSGEYPYVQAFEGTPFTEKVNVLISCNGEIDEKSIYQFSTNPWLPLSEYVEEYDRLPLATEQLVEDRKHLPVWFMTKHYRNSREISLAYNLIELGEEFVNDMLDQVRQIEDDEKREDVPKEPKTLNLCYPHQAGYSPWEVVDDIFNSVEEDCVLCILENQLWSARKRSTLANSVSERLDAYREIAPLRSRITFLIEKHYPILLSSLPQCLQSDEVGNVFAADIDSDDDLLGSLGFG